MVALATFQTHSNHMWLVASLWTAQPEKFEVKSEGFFSSPNKRVPQHKLALCVFSLAHTTHSITVC